MPKKVPRQGIHIRLRPSIVKILDNFAAELEYSRSEFARILLTEGLERHQKSIFAQNGSNSNQ